MLIQQDNEIWTLVCTGDRKSFEHLYNSYVTELYQYGLKFTSKSELIEDCIQELFTGIFNNHKNLEKNANIRFYLYKSFKNNLLRILEKEKIYHHSANDEYQFKITFSAEQNIVSSETEQLKRKSIVEGIKNLTSSQKEIIYLKYTRGLNYEEIASLLNMEAESCRNAMYRAIKNLRQKVKRSSIIFHFFYKKS